MPEALLFFKALSDETRLRLLLVLNRYELNVNELVDLLGMGQSRISRHLKILSNAGLLMHRRDGLWVFYSATSAGSGRKFIDAVLPFMASASFIEKDLALAAGMIEERASRTSQFFNSIAEDWDSMSQELLGNFELEGTVLEMMPAKCGVAVDLGCGTGNMLEKMLPRAEQVIGVDGSAMMLELARRRFGSSESQISLRIGDLEHLPLRDAEADFVCINLVLHHLSNPLLVLQEVKRVLKPGGIFVLSEFDKHEDESLRIEYGDRWLGFESEVLELYIKQAGLHLEQTIEFPVEKNLMIKFLKANNIM